MDNKLFKGISFFIGLFIASSVIANSKYEQMNKLPQSAVKLLFLQVIESKENTCTNVDELTLMGNNENDEGSWTVSCSHGDRFLIKVLNDARGTLQVEDCSNEDISEPCLSQPTTAIVTSASTAPASPVEPEAKPELTIETTPIAQPTETPTTLIFPKPEIDTEAEQSSPSTQEQIVEETLTQEKSENEAEVKQGEDDF